MHPSIGRVGATCLLGSLPLLPFVVWEQCGLSEATGDGGRKWQPNIRGFSKLSYAVPGLDADSFDRVLVVNSRDSWPQGSFSCTLCTKVESRLVTAEILRFETRLR